MTKKQEFSDQFIATTRLHEGLHNLDDFYERCQCTLHRVRVADQFKRMFYDLNVSEVQLHYRWYQPVNERSAS